MKKQHGSQKNCPGTLSWIQNHVFHPFCPFLHLAASHLHSQSFCELSRRPHHECQQRSRINSLPYLYNRQLQLLPSFHSCLPSFTSKWLSSSMKHRFSLHDNVDAMRAVQLPFVARNRYVKLRCNCNPGCGRHSTNAHGSPKNWEGLFNETSTPQSMMQDDGRSP